VTFDEKEDDEKKKLKILFIHFYLSFYFLFSIKLIKFNHF